MKIDHAMTSIESFFFNFSRCGPQGGTLIFFLISRLGSSLYRSPQKYQEFRAPPKTFEILATQNNISPPPFCTLTLRKDP